MCKNCVNLQLPKTAKKIDLTGGRGARIERVGGGKNGRSLYTHIHLDKFYQNFGPSDKFWACPLVQLSSFPAFWV